MAPFTQVVPLAVAPANTVLRRGARVPGFTPFGYGCTERSGFTGQWSEGGRYLLGNGYRAYFPALGRFGAADELSPFGRGGLNAYAYCWADPVNHRDPSGRMGKLIMKLLGVGAGKADDVVAVSMRRLSGEFVHPQAVTTLEFSGRAYDFISPLRAPLTTEQATLAYNATASYLSMSAYTAGVDIRHVLSGPSVRRALDAAPAMVKLPDELAPLTFGAGRAKGDRALNQAIRSQLYFQHFADPEVVARRGAISPAF